MPLLLAATIALLPAGAANGKGRATTDEPELLSSETFAGLALRGIGPAVASGRVGDLAVNPRNHAHYIVAVASGGVWKTTNSGTTWTPIFDSEGSYSIGCVRMDPKNPSVIWVGTGENNSQRSVSFGDGVYKSLDGGASWKRMGLAESEHIGMITIDPRDSDRVFVAAQGPLWRSGGDRGLYRTTDGGDTWERVLEISDNTGVNEVVMDPRDPDVLYASAYQRRRRVWTLIDGGPESAIYKSTDGGDTWRKLGSGLPEVDMGRIGLAVSPADPDVVYAIIEAARDEGGFFRSTDRGETWTKRSDHVASSPQYYNEIVCDPSDVDRVYSLETYLHVTADGGATFAKVPGRYRHVDDHALWIDPDNTDYLLVGCDGGVYESFDRGSTWHFKANLPVTQFYRVSVDNAAPFYNVYGGTQDNATLGGPSRTRDHMGITNAHWFVTVFGDGFKTQVDPEDPNIVYSQSQYGGLVRHDRRSGENVNIRPEERPGDEPYRWNWDAPLIISPHSNRRLYFAASRLFRSEDRGNSWQAISDDLSRGLDRNALAVMGRIWGVDAVAKHASTSIYGNAVALTESPVTEGLIWVGTDDGLVHVTSNDGETWTRVDRFPGVPERTYVSQLTASQHDADTVYAAFDNHKSGDFGPYLLKSTDRGSSWTSIAGDLPDREIVYAIAEDHVKPGLLFVGSEFGVWFSIDGGSHWVKLTGGMPTIAVRDIAIQKRENDLVLATFGRGFFILDDYTPLRRINAELLDGEALLFPTRPALAYMEHSRLGLRLEKAFQGDSCYTAPNPPYGAVLTYYLKDGLKTRAEKRAEKEKKAAEEGHPPHIPTIEELRLEDEEVEPEILLTVRDEDGDVVRRIVGPRSKGMHRVAWDLRYPPSTPVDLSEDKDRSPWDPPPKGPHALPGTYTATLASRIDGQITDLADPVQIEVRALELATLAADDRAAVLAFQKKVSRLRRAVEGALMAADEAADRLVHLRQAVIQTPAANPELLAEIHRLERRLEGILVALRGDETRGSRNEPQPPSISRRVDRIVGSQWDTTSAPTQTQQDGYRYAAEAFGGELKTLRQLIEVELERIEQRLEAAGAPWTPSRLPIWQPE